MAVEDTVQDAAQQGLELTLTDAAVSKTKDFYAKMPEAAGKPLRIFIQGGGCSGFQYGFAFEEERPDDFKRTYSGIDIVIDPKSAVMLNGSVVDYIEDFRGAGYNVSNPNAKSSCGCGKSFC